MSNLFIGVKRIIAVDSSEFAYAELDVDAHSMLVAEGNVGKSSLINAIRLFFLPECTLAKQAVNFGFCDSNGDMYGSETTFNHYFPSKYSFLILEYEKRLFDGPHCCQIISASQSGRLKFERMFTQLPYNKLRPLFWQQGDDPDGIGQRVENLSKQNVYDYINQHDKTCVLAKEASKVAPLLYENALQATRYTLFPLKNQEPQTVNSLRALIKLLFIASGKNKRPFTDAIANIIEGGKKTEQDQLGFSISEFKDQHENLKHQEDQLNAIINQHKLYQSLCKNKDSFERYLSALGPVKPALAYLEQGKTNLQHELQDIAEQKAKALTTRKTAEQAFQEIHDDIRIEKRQLKEYEKASKEQQAVLDRFAELENEFVGQTLEFIQQTLQEELNDKETELGVLTGSISRAEALASVENQIKPLQQQMADIEHAIANTEFSLENQLDKDQLNWLYSINPQLAAANTGRAITTQQKQALQGFADLFDVHPTYYQFFNVKLGFAPYNKQNLNAQLDKISLELQSLHKQKSKLEDENKNALHAEHSLAQVQQNIALAKKDLAVLNNLDYAQKRVNELKADIKIVHASLQANESRLHAAEKALEEAKKTTHKITTDYQECQARIQENQALLSRLKNFVVLHSKWLALTESDHNHDEPQRLTQEQISMYESYANKLGEVQFTLLSGLRKFIEIGIMQDNHQISSDTPNWPEIAASFEGLNEVYGNLETQRSLLGKQIEEHNQTIGTKKEIIVQNYRIIKAFEKDINQAFSGLTINNVAKVEFEVGINKQFETLVKEFEETNLYSQQMLSEEFYIRLVAFAERFFDASDSFTLTMDKVIESFEPRVQLRNKAGKEEKRQSNSTNALIKIKLVQLLLKRLIYHNCETSFPIVHDEIANIDIGQFDWWLADLTANGFNLMAAGTHSTSPELQAKIGRRHVMDALTTALPYHSERSRVYWKGAEEFSALTAESSPDQQAELI